MVASPPASRPGFTGTGSEDFVDALMGSMARSGRNPGRRSARGDQVAFNICLLLQTKYEEVGLYIYFTFGKEEKCTQYTNKERTRTRHQIKLQVKKGTTLAPFNTELPNPGSQI